MLPGIDITFGLANLGGQWDSYLSLLRRYGRRQRDNPVRIRACLEAGHLEQGRRLAHNLKGVAGSLALTQVQAQAAALEAALKAGRPAPEIALLLEAVEDAHQEVIQAILTLDQEPPTRVANAADIGPALEQLADLLDQGDASAGWVMEEVRSALLAKFGAPAEQLIRQVESFDYGAALSTVRKLSEFPGK
jgi:two-component system sensor histidine kinase/response regulator